MNSKAILSFAGIAAFAAVAAFASTAARAEDGAPYQVALKAKDSRPRAEVKAEAVTAPAHVNSEGDPARVAVLRSGLDAKAVRAEAAQALRLGQIRSGEIGSL